MAPLPRGSDSIIFDPAASREQVLEEGLERSVKKHVFSLGDHWEVTADDTHAADIRGEFIRLWDCYVMRPTNGQPAWHGAKRMIAFGATIDITPESAHDSVPVEDAIMMFAVANEITSHHTKVSTSRSK